MTTTTGWCTRVAKAMAVGLPFLCYDESQRRQRLTHSLYAGLFLFDTNRQLVYRGQLDDSRPSNGKPVTGEDLRAAIDAVLAGKPVNPEQKPSVGCNIVETWKRTQLWLEVASKLKALNSFSCTTFAQAASSSNRWLSLIEQVPVIAKNHNLRRYSWQTIENII